MLKELFESSFYKTFPKRENVLLSLDEHTANGDFGIVDRHACNGCRYVCSSNPKVREQLRVHCNHVVSWISIEQVFSYVRDNVGEICDFMLEGDNTVCMIEMTCSTVKYANNKRVKARKQLRNTLSLLCANPDVKDHLDKKKEHYVVFSWKETFSGAKEHDEVEDCMSNMILMADEIYSPDNESPFDNGFKLKEIRYPNVLVCQ